MKLKCWSWERPRERNGVKVKNWAHCLSRTTKSDGNRIKSADHLSPSSAEGPQDPSSGASLLSIQSLPCEPKFSSKNRTCLSNILLSHTDHLYFSLICPYSGLGQKIQKQNSIHVTLEVQVEDKGETSTGSWVRYWGTPFRFWICI